MSLIVDIPKNTQMIDEMYAYVSVDRENSFEGVIGLPSYGGLPIPAVGADMKRMQQLRPVVRQVAKQFGITVRLLKFSKREILETISGQD